MTQTTQETCVHCLREWFNDERKMKVVERKEWRNVQKVREIKGNERKSLTNGVSFLETITQAQC